jgi:DnaJ domain
MIGTGFVGLDPAGYYSRLQVSQDATAEEIRRAYRDAARRWHPDINPSSEAAEQMKAINEAFDVLGNPTTRAAYDSLCNQSGSIWATSSVGDFGQHRANEFTSLVFTIRSNGPISSLDISSNRGSWWNADIEFVGVGDHLLTISVRVSSSLPGSYADSIVVSAGESEVKICFKAVVLEGTSSRLSNDVVDSPDSWSPRFQRFVRWGLFGLLLAWFSSPNVVDHVAGIRNEYAGQIASWSVVALGILILTCGHRTGWFKRGGRRARTLACVAAGIGWITLVTFALAMLAIVIVIAAISALVALVLAIGR